MRFWFNRLWRRKRSFCIRSHSYFAYNWTATYGEVTNGAVWLECCDFRHWHCRSGSKTIILRQQQRQRLNLLRLHKWSELHFLDTPDRVNAVQLFWAIRCNKFNIRDCRCWCIWTADCFCCWDHLSCWKSLHLFWLYISFVSNMH